MKEQYTANTETTIFLSYSYKDNEIVEKLDSDLGSFEGINIVRCEREIDYTKSIKEFMRRIRITDYVLIVISDEFIKSMNCMYEINELSKDEDYKSRILPVFPYANNDVRIAKIFKPEDRLEYIKYWNEKRDALDNKLKKLPRESTSKLCNDLNKYREICNTVGEFIDTISDMNCFTFDKLKEENYKSILDKIEYVKFLSKKLPIQPNPDSQIQHEQRGLVKGESKKLKWVKDTSKKGKWNMLAEKLSITSNSDSVIIQFVNEKEEIEKRYEDDSKKDKWKQTVSDAVKENRFEDAIKIIEEVNKPNDMSSAEAHFEISKIFYLKLDYHKALYHCDLAAKFQPENTLYLNSVGYISQILGKYDDALKYYNTVLKKETEDSVLKGSILNNIGTIYADKGNHEKAIEYYEKALAIDKKIYGEENPKIAVRYNNIGEALRNKGFYKDAFGYYEKALVIDKKSFGEEHPSIATSYNNIGSALSDMDEYESAVDYFGKALVILKKHYSEIHPYIAKTYSNIGDIWRKKKSYDKAIEYFQKAFAIDIKIYKEEHPEIIIDYNNIASAYFGKNYFNEAIEYFEKALQISRKYYGDEHPITINIINNLKIARDLRDNNNNSFEIQ